MKASARIIEADGECRLRLEPQLRILLRAGLGRRPKGRICPRRGLRRRDAPETSGRSLRARRGGGDEPPAARIAAGRVTGSGTVICGDFMATQDFAPESFDAITCVACLHHMPLETALIRMAELLRPDSILLVVGLSANRTIADWLLSALMVVPARVSGWLYHEGTYQGMRVARPRESLGEIRAIAGERLPRRTCQEASLLALLPRADEAPHCAVLAPVPRFVLCPAAWFSLLRGALAAT